MTEVNAQLFRNLEEEDVKGDEARGRSCVMSSQQEGTGNASARLVCSFVGFVSMATISEREKGGERRGEHRKRMEKETHLPGTSQV